MTLHAMGLLMERHAGERKFQAKIHGYGVEEEEQMMTPQMEANFFDNLVERTANQ